MSRCSLSRHVQEHYFQRRATAGGLQMVQLTCSNATLRVLAGGHCCGGEAAIHPRILKGSSNIGRYCPSAELSCGCRSRLTGTGRKRQDSVRLVFFWVCCTNGTRRLFIGEWLFISNFLLTTFSSCFISPSHLIRAHTPGARHAHRPAANSRTSFRQTFFCCC